MKELVLKDYFKIYGNVYQKEILLDRYLFVEKGMTDEDLCVEITDSNGNAVNIGSYVDISINTMICDLQDIVLDYLFDNYLYSHQ